MLTRIIAILAVLMFILTGGVYLSKTSPGFLPESLKQVIFWVILIASVGFCIVYSNTIKEVLRKKSTYYNLNLGLILSLLLGILLFSNYIANIYKLRFDITEQGLHSLSPQTINILNKVPEKIELIYFEPPSPHQEKITKLMELFKYKSRKIEYRVLDPNSHPSLASSLGIKKSGTLAVRFFEKEKSKTFKVRRPTEEKITNGILKLIKEREPKVYLLQGHGERSTNQAKSPLSVSFLKQYMQSEVYAVEELFLLKEGKIPADTDALFILGPQTSFFPKEINLIKKYFEDGGRILLALDVDAKYEGLPPGAKQIATWLKEYSINVGNEMLVDTASRLVKQEAQVVVALASSPSHPITKDFPRSNMQNKRLPSFYFPLSTLLWKDNKAGSIPSMVMEPIVQSSPQAWAENSWKDIKRGRVSRDPIKEEKGSMDIGISVEIKENKAKMLVFATSAFLVNGLIDAARNKDLLLNSLAWLTDKEDMISIRTKERHDTKLHMEKRSIDFIFWMTVIIIPASFLIYAFWVWRARKNK